MRKKRIVLATATICFLVAVILFGIGLCTVNTYVYTSASGFISTTGHVYLISPLLRIRIGWDPGQEEGLQSSREDALHSAILSVAAVDPQAYRDKYAALEKQVFPIDGQIYYYRENVFDGFFCLDVATEKVRKCSFSEYSEYVHVADEERATIDHIGMHNFIIRNSILAEGLMEHYPAMAEQIESSGVSYFAPWTYWDNGRIFFSADSVVYEYLPGKDKLKKLVKIGEAETVRIVQGAG